MTGAGLSLYGNLSTRNNELAVTHPTITLTRFMGLLACKVDVMLHELYSGSFLYQPSFVLPCDRKDGFP